MRRFFFIALFFLAPDILLAKSIGNHGPIRLRTQHPVYLQTVNLFPDRAQSLSPGLFEIRIDNAYSNLYERGTSTGNNINLDMELQRMGLMLHYSFYPTWEVTAEIPLLSFHGGFLDGFVQNFHDFFGFPNGGREQVANRIFVYEVTSNGRTYAPTEQRWHLGDVTFTSKHQILEEGVQPFNLAWRAAFKIPSGETEKGLGSGNPGFGLGIALDKSFWRFKGYLNLNYLLEGGNESLPEMLGQTYFDFTTAVAFGFSRRASLIVQLTGGTARLSGTDLEVWNGVPLDFIVGFTGEIPLSGPESLFVWQVGFSEDIRAVGPSIDFTVFTSLGFRFPVGGKRGYKGDFVADAKDKPRIPTSFL